MGTRSNEVIAEFLTYHMDMNLRLKLMANRPQEYLDRCIGTRAKSDVDNLIDAIVASVHGELKRKAEEFFK